MSLGWFSKNRLDIHVYIFIIYVYLKESYLHNWALSIQPKFRKIRSETRWNGPFLLGPTEIFGTTFKGHHFDRSAHFGRADGPFHLHSYLTRLMSNINNRNKLQLMQIISNVMLYSQHFTFHWKLLV